MRKHLGFSVAEWDALPWWQSRMYAELLDEYLAAERGEEITDGPLDNDDEWADPRAARMRERAARFTEHEDDPRVRAAAEGRELTPTERDALADRAEAKRVATNRDELASLGFTIG